MSNKAQMFQARNGYLEFLTLAFICHWSLDIGHSGVAQ
jgi:hypothetical protein